MGEGAKHGRQNEHRQRGANRHSQRDVEHNDGQRNEQYAATDPKNPLSMPVTMPLSMAFMQYRNRTGTAYPL